MRICIVSIQWIPIITGGGGVAVLNLVKELAKNNQITVYTFGQSGLPEKEEMMIDGSRINVVRVFTSDSDKISTPFDGTKEQEIRRLLEFKSNLLKILDCDEFDVIHLHGHFVVPSMAKNLKSKGCRAKIISTIHAFESIIELEKGEYSSRKNVYETIVSMERDSLNFSDVVTIASRSLLRMIEKIHGEKYKKRIKIVPIGISDRFFKPSNREDVLKIRKKFGENAFLIFNLNRIDPSKGIHYILLALDLLGEKVKKNIALVIAGKFEKRNIEYLKYLEELKQKIENKYDNMRIYVLRNIPERMKINLYDASDIFVMASPSEPFGITILESLARGLPVIVTDSEGPREIFKIYEYLDKPFIEIRGGVMVRFASPERRIENLSLAIIYALQEYKRLRKMAKDMGQEIKKRYSWKSIATFFVEKIYRM